MRKGRWLIWQERVAHIAITELSLGGRNLWSREMTHMPTGAEWDDPDVQIVYELLCDTADAPPEGEHYEGWMAIRIVAALRVKNAHDMEGRK